MRRKEFTERYMKTSQGRKNKRRTISRTISVTTGFNFSTSASTRVALTLSRSSEVDVGAVASVVLLLCQFDWLVDLRSDRDSRTPNLRRLRVDDDAFAERLDADEDPVEIE